ncbi:uncharacterized protein LOC6562722 [Drosophila grimshawi]|uniref:GH10755 n=1 Tax=Drosophila grimshawi TaxID=7222 RepID=B4JBM8_DROGR|nr:uncharacterized protein LOC6562722 [Drosophila grimshawi]EDW02963.1 GH10755 [Drosophila grimshawi]
MATYTCTQYVNFADPASIGKMSTTYTLDAAHFGQHDLGLFIESLETIERIERQRHERRQRRREQKLREARIAELESDRCVSPTPSAEEAVDEPLTYLEAKCIPYAISEALPIIAETGSPTYDVCDDEAYGSANQTPRSSVTYCSCAGGLDSDSTESGIYGGSTPPVPLRPRSQVISKPKNRTTRSRIISMVLKRDYAKAPSTESLGHKMHCGRHQLNQMSSKARRGIASSQSSVEECFLDKALRFMTL